MSRISVLHISDIHYERNEPENQGLILNSFFADLEQKIDKTDRENTYCIISGDLVNKGNSNKVFDDFYDFFIKNLIKYVPLQHIYCSPGNHDLNRTIVEDNLLEHDEIVARSYTESEFNDFIKQDKNLLKRKFQFFENFCKNKLQIPNYKLEGYDVTPIPELSFYFLNCSFLSYGGYNDKEDKGILKVETSNLNNWISKNLGRTRVLVMHHPLEYLTEFARNEIKSMLVSEIDVLISGHIHEQDLNHNYGAHNHEAIKIGSPQLFSNKTDLNGYSILRFNGKNLDSIEYRQWVKRQRKFMVGQEFSSTENGIRKFVIAENVAEDTVLEKLQRNFSKAMKSYSRTPVWVERTLRTTSPTSNKKDFQQLDYVDVLNTSCNYQIIGAHQFGLTCYARYLSLKAFEINRNKWLYLDAKNWTYAQYHDDLEQSLVDCGFQIHEVSCVLLDNWKNSNKEAQKILDNIKRKFLDVRLIIFSSFSDNAILQGLDSQESHEGFTQLYLCELSRRGLRNIVKNFNEISLIADENRVLALD